MIKKILIILLCVIPFLVKAQLPIRPSTFPNPNSPTGFTKYGWQLVDSGFQWKPRVNNFQPNTGYTGLRYSGDTLYYWAIDSGAWLQISFGDNNPRIAGGAFTTSNIGIGFNPGSNLTVQQLIDSVWYGEQPPTITLTGGTIIELTSATSVSNTLSLNACRGSNTTDLIRITIHGSDATDYPITFSNPSQSGCTGTITQSVPVPANTSTTYTDTVTTQSGKQATATTSFTFEPKWYYGFVDSSIHSPNSAQLIALTGTLTASLSAIKTQTSSGVTVSNSSPSRFVVAVPTNYDPSSTLQIWINGLNSTGAFNETTTSITNASGYVQNYNIYTQSTVTSAGVSFQIK